MADSFFQQVYQIVAQIPRGKVMSYGQIAGMLGNPRAARQVGWAMRVCPDDICWQRVVRADGSIAGGECAQIRRQMLQNEGIVFMDDGRVNMKACNWHGAKVESGDEKT